MKIFYFFIFLILWACTSKSILLKVEPPYVDKQINGKVLLIAPIPEHFETGPLIIEDSQPFVEQYHNFMAQNMAKVLAHESTFSKAYYSDFPVYSQLEPVTLPLSSHDSLFIQLPPTKGPAQLKKQYLKLKPDFVLFFELEALDYAMSSTRSPAAGNISFNFSLAHQFKFAFWDVKANQLVCYGHKVVTGNLKDIGRALVEQTPFEKKNGPK